MLSDQWQTMSLTAGPGTLPREDNRVFAAKKTNDISDIDGARSAVRYRVYEDKPAWMSTADISGAQSKQLSRSRNTRDNTLYIDDIEGTRRTIKDRMMRTTRHVNPLCPDYPLPSFGAMEPTQTRFLKDQLEINDIEGTHPKPQKTFATRDIMNTNDIEGTRPGLKSITKLQQCPTRDLLNVNDIAARTRYVDKTHRVTDPNNPQYVVHDIRIEDDKYTKPRAPRKYVPGFALETADIKGAGAGSLYESPFPRREYRNTNFIGDIEGSKADTIRPGITTKRETHPLQPVYQALDRGELLLPVIAPLIPAEMVRVPTLPSVHSGNEAPAASVPRPKSEPRADSRGMDFNPSVSWGNTADFGSATFNYTGDFGATAEPATGRPPRPASLALPLNNNTFSSQPYAQGNGHNSGGNTNRSATQRTGNTANNVLNLGASNTYNANKTSRSTGPSPQASGRATPSAAQKKAYLDRQADIDMVRQLSF